jgi:hypothetical protein
MIVQAMIDAIIDLAIPVTSEYQNVIGDLELDVLTEPSIKHTTALYVVTSEIASMRGFISPIVNLINALKDHKSAGVIAGGRSDMQKPASPGGVEDQPDGTNIPGRCGRSHYLNDRIARSDAEIMRQHDRPHFQHHFRIPERIYEAAHCCHDHFPPNVFLDW